MGEASKGLVRRAAAPRPGECAKLEVEALAHSEEGSPVGLSRATCPELRGVSYRRCAKETIERYPPTESNRTPPPTALTGHLPLHRGGLRFAGKGLKSEYKKTSQGIPRGTFSLVIR